MALKLYVDVLTDDGKVAMVTNHLMISRNAESLNLSLKKDQKLHQLLRRLAGMYVLWYSHP